MELATEFGPYNTVKLVYNDVRTGVTHWFAFYKEGNQVVSGMPGMRIEVTTEHGPDYPGGFHCEASILEMIEVVQGYAYGQEWALAL